MFRGRLWQTRQEVGVAVRASFSVFEGVIECGEELEPSLDSDVVVPHFAYAFQSLVVGEYPELGAPEVAAEALESPGDAASLQIERIPMPFRVQRSSADVRDGFYGAVRLLLFESGSEPIDAGIAVHVKRAYAVGDGVPIRENEDRRGRELRQDFSHQVLHSRREDKL